ncbi:TIM barrel protein [Verrucomicrobiaceae bacterium R5-34]|uniref:TIM barrel protein n=1 Tax=Oceaniferula flava TaxID=2800421 RepID=A0AAE2SAH0_9BACT|nr:sugar phosphate isomerase/epimerase family protein [Oceaniferula flavus]MBK1830403.1 TIM barrel protein [Verrucomicrobiaceae bacterium R5-34]MBK1854495.1 TIM barrel protein [Oceaniferula flavus]MBM1135801.1 TIM barrel protein [Oceaniferula flavus]
MNRRTFTKLTLASALLGPAATASANDKNPAFKAKFAPTLNQLPTAPKDYVDQLKFAYDHGFRAWEDNWLKGRGPKVWEKVGSFCNDKGITLGVSVITAGYAIDFSKATKEDRAKLAADMKKGVELAKATGQTHMTFLPGSRNEMPLKEQIAKSVDTMHHCCDIVEEHGIILVQEPLSHQIRKKDPLLRSFEDGHMLCKAVNRKSCKLLADFYHEGEIGHGDRFIEIIEKVWDEVAYVQFGDSPGRKEPGTGKLDLGSVAKWLREKNYTGVIGMEHGVKGKGEEGLNNLIAAYRKIDA